MATPQVVVHYTVTLSTFNPREHFDIVGRQVWLAMARSKMISNKTQKTKNHILGDGEQGRNARLIR